MRMGGALHGRFEEEDALNRFAGRRFREEARRGRGSRGHRRAAEGEGPRRRGRGPAGARAARRPGRCRAVGRRARGGRGRRQLRLRHLRWRQGWRQGQVLHLLYLRPGQGQGRVRSLRMRLRRLGRYPQLGEQLSPEMSIRIRAARNENRCVNDLNGRFADGVVHLMR